MKAVDTVVIIATTLISVTILIFGFGLLMMPFSTGSACGFASSNIASIENFNNKTIERLT